VASSSAVVDRQLSLIVVLPTSCPARTTYGFVGDAGGQQVNAMSEIHHRSEAHV
jgi:hypothetical protein